MEKKLLIVKLSPYQIESLHEFCKLVGFYPDQVISAWIKSLHDQIEMKNNPATKPLYDYYVDTIRGCK